MQCGQPDINELLSIVGVLQKLAGSWRPLPRERAAARRRPWRRSRGPPDAHDPCRRPSAGLQAEDSAGDVPLGSPKGRTFAGSWEDGRDRHLGSGKVAELELELTGGFRPVPDSDVCQRRLKSEQVSTAEN